MAFFDSEDTNLWRLDAATIDSLIRSRDLKRYWVAEATGVHLTTLRRWLNGDIQNVREIHVERLARVLQTTPNEIGKSVSGLRVNFARAAPSRRERDARELVTVGLAP